MNQGRIILAATATLGRVSRASFLIPVLSITATAAIIVLDAADNGTGERSLRAGVRLTRIATVKDSSRPVRLIPFICSASDAYILELGDRYIRFYRNGAQVQSGGNPYEIASPWDANDLFEIQYSQDARTMRLKHPRYPPYRLSRNSPSDTDWALSEDSSDDK